MLEASPHELMLELCSHIPHLMLEACTCIARWNWELPFKHRCLISFSACIAAMDIKCGSAWGKSNADDGLAGEHELRR